MIFNVMYLKTFFLKFKRADSLGEFMYNMDMGRGMNIIVIRLNG